MKNISNILMLAIAILVVPACGTQSEKKSETSSEEVTESAAERSARLDQEKMDRTEQRRLERLALAESNPTYTDSMGELVYIMGEVDPSYVGGNKAMMNYLRDNLSYPKDAQNRGDEGTVFVDFIVTKTGSVRGVEITDLDSENVDQSLRDEAIRVVSSMPAWTPGSQLGTTVNVKYSIPITFRM